MKKLSALILSLTMLTGCGADESSDDNKASVKEVETTVTETSEVQTETPQKADKEAVINAAKAYVSGLEDFSTITNYDSPEIKEVTELYDYHHITDDFINDNNWYEVTFLTTDDALLGPISVYLDSNCTAFGLGLRE